MKKILITTSSFDLSNFADISILRNAGFEIQCNPYGKRLNEEQISNLMDDQVIAMIAGTEPLTESVLGKATSLKIIVRCGIGMDNVDMEAAAKLGIIVRNTPDAPSRSVAELTLAHILSLLRRISESDRQIRSGKWQSLMGSLLYGQTVGIIGYGRIGRMVSNLVLAFGAKVLVYDLMPITNTSNDIEIVSREILFEQSDVITLHLPYTKENHHLIDTNVFNIMKPDSVLINVSRGGLVDDNALFDAIKNKKISGAAMDCFEEEPYNGPLIACSEVQFTAHMGSYAKQSRIKQEQDSCEILVNELQLNNII